MLMSQNSAFTYRYSVSLVCLCRQVFTCSVCVQRRWSLTSSNCRRVTMLRSFSPSVNRTTRSPASPATEMLTSLKTSARDMTSTPSWPPGELPAVYWSCCLSVVMSMMKDLGSALSVDRKTFPSQHATLSAFAAVYISVRKPSVTFKCIDSESQAVSQGLKRVLNSLRESFRVSFNE